MIVIKVVTIVNLNIFSKFDYEGSSVIFLRRPGFSKTYSRPMYFECEKLLKKYLLYPEM